MKKLMQISVVVAFVFYWVPLARSSLVTFEGISDSTQIENQYNGLGITFTGATILIAGDSLNELEFPPKSGANVVFDDSGPMNIFFSTPVQQVEAYFTYATPLTLSFFNSSNASIGNISSMFSSNMALSGNSGSSPNELLGLIYLPGIARLSITGDLSGTSFVMDDLTTTPVLKTAPVPEPATLLLLGGGIAGLTTLQLKKARRFA